MHGTGRVPALIVVSVVTIAFLEKTLTWPIALLLLVVFPFVRYVIHVVIARIAGPELEVVSTDESIRFQRFD